MTKLTEEALREEIGKGLNPSQIAKKYGLSRQAVTKRVNAMRLMTTTVATLAPVAPLEARTFVETKRTAIDELLEFLIGVKKLYAACTEWLTDANDPEKFDIGPRGEEIWVTYWDASEAGEDEDGVRKAVRKKATLQELLRRIDDKGILTIKSETKYADPRELILKTAGECRQIISQCQQLALLMADARAMEMLRAAILRGIEKVSPELAKEIADEVRSILILHQSTGGLADQAAPGGIAV